MGGDQRAEACYAGGHQRHIRHRADGYDRETRWAADALAQYEGVLGPTIDDLESVRDRWRSRSAVE